MNWYNDVGIYFTSEDISAHVAFLVPLCGRHYVKQHRTADKTGSSCLPDTFLETSEWT